MKKNKVSGYRKGQEIKVRIIDIGMRGEGIGKLEDGYTVFIKDAVVGDYVRASIMKANKSYAYAHLDQILQASPHRVWSLFVLSQGSAADASCRRFPMNRNLSISKTRCALI